MQLEMYQPQLQQPVTVVFSTAARRTVPFASGIYESYKSRQAMISGIMLITTGVLSVIFRIGSFYGTDAVGFVGHSCGSLVSKICCNSVLLMYLFAYSVIL